MGAAHIPAIVAASGVRRQTHAANAHLWDIFDDLLDSSAIMYRSAAIGTALQRDFCALIHGGRRLAVRGLVTLLAPGLCFVSLALTGRTAKRSSLTAGFALEIFEAFLQFSDPLSKRLDESVTLATARANETRIGTSRTHI
jgi:hypothetical protein